MWDVQYVTSEVVLQSYLLLRCKCPKDISFGDYVDKYTCLLILVPLEVYVEII